MIIKFIKRNNCHKKVNRPKLLLLISVFFLSSIILSCSDSKTKSLSAINGRGFPTEDGAAGSDAISASTNHSDKQNETDPELSPYASAGYVAPAKINNYGSVGLGYSIEVLPGRAGLQPGVSIGYSSSGGDGLCGIGWSFSAGLGAISRTTQHGQLYYDQRDVFTFNGKRLVKVEGDNESQDGVYRLEIESGFSKFVLSDADNGGTWTVYDKAGTVTTFGKNLNHRIYHPDDNSNTYCWYFSESVDLHGNYAYAVYDDSLYTKNNVLYIQEIRYTGNYNTGDEPRQFVRFVYTERDDQYVTRSAGFVMSIDRLLHKIEIGWDDPDSMLGGSTVLWDYTMVYETSEDSNRPLLKTIESTRTTTQPEFTYGETNHTLRWQRVENPFSNDTELNPDATKYFEGDFNGDGISDMVFFNPETGEWKAAQGYREGGYTFPIYGNMFQGFDSEKKIQFFKGNVTGDYNGDGRSDIAFYLPETKMFWVAQHNGHVFDFVNYGSLIVDVDIFSCEWFPGDYDGNGLSDIVLYHEKTGEWFFMRNTGSGFEITTFSHKFKNLYRNDYQPNSNLDNELTSDTSSYGIDRGKVNFFTGDYNGDGRSDISIYDSRRGEWWVAENLRQDGIGFRLNWKLYKKFTVPEQSLFAHTRFSGDFNGDGYSDFLLFDKESGEWILGATGNDNITFTIYSKVPQFKEITRWLQGDFNGDGRTDIGFYSATDQNFWIGEATPSGFRYRIYSNMSYGPDHNRVMQTPEPKALIKLEKNETIISGSSSTVKLAYQYDGNYNTGRGENVYPGFYTDSELPQMLIFDKAQNRVYYYDNNVASGFSKDENADNATPFLALSLNNITMLNNSRPWINDPNQSKGLLYYEKSGENHNFGFVHIVGEDPKQPERSILVSVSETLLPNFDLNRSLYIIDQFNETSDKDLLVCNTTDDVSSFKLVSGTITEATDVNNLSIKLDGYATFEDCPDNFKTLFTNYANSTSLVHVFSGKFDNTTGFSQILIADTREDIHRWYVGVIEGTAIHFYKINTSIQFPYGTYTGHCRFESDNSSFIIPTAGNNQARFNTVTVTKSATTGEWTLDIQSSELINEVTFNEQYDHNNNPILYSNGQVKVYDLGEAKLKDFIVGSNDYTSDAFNRTDLVSSVYPFRWIQGDYNGDNKTDIGIFHLRESEWYFAVSSGTVPDLLTRVDNGIGGYYLYEYENSSRFDNTGDDDIPDLPMNYKVCVKQTIDDGFARRLVTKYEYKNGFAFSGFLKGYKEVDSFGFSTFTIIDALGSKSISTYHTTPYDDFRKNRALAGAIKSSRFLGWDQKEYTRTDYQYKIHEIVPSGAPLTPRGYIAKSYLIEPVAVREYMRNSNNDLELVKTSRSNIVLTENQYAMESKVAGVTDHYQDAAHAPVTNATYTLYENIETTNQMRPVEEKTFITVTDYETNVHANTDYTVRSTYSYNSYGDVNHKETEYVGGALTATETQISDVEYDDYGNAVRTINNTGTPARIREQTYDDKLHQFVVTTTAVGDSINLSEQFEIDYGPAFGGVTEKTDPNGNKSYYEYDDFGRLQTSYTDIDGTKEKINEYSYVTEPYMNVKLTRYSGYGNAPLELRVYVDGIGRTLHTVRSATTTIGKRYIRSGKTVYDPLGRVTRQSQPDWAADTEIDEYVSVLVEKNPTKTEYDATGRIKKVITPKTANETEETAVTYTYTDPWEVVVTHSIGRSSRTITNASGQVLYSENWGTGDDGSTVRNKIGFAYDPVGKRIKKFDIETDGPLVAGQDIDLSIPALGSSVVRTDINNDVYWWYDGFGRIVATNDPDFGASSVEYNSFGELYRSTDALGRTTQFNYDRLGRLTSKVLPGSEGTVIYTYDSLSYSNHALGRMVAMEDPNQRKEFNYDELGRVVSERRTMKDQGDWSGEEAYETLFTYDFLSRHRTITYPIDTMTGNRAVVSYTYSPMGVQQVSAVSGGVTKNLISSIVYNEFGQMDRVLRGNGTQTSYSYDIKGRLTNLETINSSGQRIQNVTYNFKIDNSIAAIENRPEIGPDGVDNSVINYNYTYDGLNRLVHATGHYERSTSGTNNRFERGYSYAQNGNMLSKTVYNPDTHTEQDRWSYTYANHKVERITSSSVGGLKFEMFYDAVGNMTEQRDHENNFTKRMEFSSGNRITHVYDPDTGDLVGKYFYDDQGSRVRKVARRFRENQWRHVELVHPSMFFGVEKQWTVEGQVIPDSQFAINNIYVNGVRFAAFTPDGEARYYLTDQVDSVKVVVDDAGVPVSSFEYLPYGETWIKEGSATNNAKYNSQELDTETGFYFYNARHYDPVICRFVTADSVVDGELSPVGWNGYAYVQGNPVVYLDPSGNASYAEYIDYQNKQNDIEKNKIHLENAVADSCASVTYNRRTHGSKHALGPVYMRNINANTREEALGFSHGLTDHYSRIPFDIANLLINANVDLQRVRMASPKIDNLCKEATKSIEYGQFRISLQYTKEHRSAAYERCYKSGDNFGTFLDVSLIAYSLAKSGLQIGVSVSKQTANVGSKKSWFPRFKQVKGPGGKPDGWTLSPGKGYGSKPRIDYHTFPKAPSKGAKGVPKILQGKRVPHYHRRGPGGIGMHRPFQKKASWKWYEFWKRF